MLDPDPGPYKMNADPQPCSLYTPFWKIGGGLFWGKRAPLAALPVVWATIMTNILF